MPEFSKASKEKLLTCHPDLQRVFNEVIKTFDCTITDGHRNERDQTYAFEKGLSTKSFPNSVHNAKPSDGVDAVPYPVDYTDKQRLYFFAGYVIATANALGITLRWGGDWDSDKNLKNQTFFDLPHFERKKHD